MPLTNPYNPYPPYNMSYVPNQFSTSAPNSNYGSAQYGTGPTQVRLDNLGAQQPVQMPNVYGHMVNSESEIKPNEVPMDGSIALFPKPDFSEIIAKQWSQDGTITTLKFVPEAKTSDSTSNDESAATMSISELAHSMDDRFDELKSMLKYRTGGKSSQKNQSESKGSNDE